MTAYEEHLGTWGPNCGAPLAVYRGHLDILLADTRKRELDRCCNVITELAKSNGFAISLGMVGLIIAKLRTTL